MGEFQPFTREYSSVNHLLSRPEYFQGVRRRQSVNCATVVALKEALNTIWDVVAPPSGGVWSLAKSYLASLVGVLALGFLLLVSLLVTTVLAAGAAYITPFLSEAALHA